MLKYFNEARRRKLFIALGSCIIAYWCFTEIKYFLIKDQLPFPDKNISYKQYGNVWLDPFMVEQLGLDLKNNLITVKGNKPKGFNVVAVASWYSYNGKCLGHYGPIHALLGMEKTEALKYRLNYYAVDHGDNYIITIPQQNDWSINRCDDIMSRLVIYFYRKSDEASFNPVRARITEITYLPNEIPLSKKYEGYPGNYVEINNCTFKPKPYGSGEKFFCKNSKGKNFNKSILFKDIKPYEITAHLNLAPEALQDVD